MSAAFLSPLAASRPRSALHALSHCSTVQHQLISLPPGNLTRRMMECERELKYHHVALLPSPDCGVIVSLNTIILPAFITTLFQDLIYLHTK